MHTSWQHEIEGWSKYTIFAFQLYPSIAYVRWSLKIILKSAVNCGSWSVTYCVNEDAKLSNGSFVKRVRVLFEIGHSNLVGSTPLKDVREGEVQVWHVTDHCDSWTWNGFVADVAFLWPCFFLHVIAFALHGTISITAHGKYNSGLGNTLQLLLEVGRLISVIALLWRCYRFQKLELGYHYNLDMTKIQELVYPHLRVLVWHAFIHESLQSRLFFGFLGSEASVPTF